MKYLLLLALPFLVMCFLIGEFVFKPQERSQVKSGDYKISLRPSFSPIDKNVRVIDEGGIISLRMNGNAEPYYVSIFFVSAYFIDPNRPDFLADDFRKAGNVNVIKKAEPEGEIIYVRLEDRGKYSYCLMYYCEIAIPFNKEKALVARWSIRHYEGANDVYREIKNVSNGATKKQEITNEIF